MDYEKKRNGYPHIRYEFLQLNLLNEAVVICEIENPANCCDAVDEHVILKRHRWGLGVSTCNREFLEESH